MWGFPVPKPKAPSRVITRSRSRDGPAAGSPPVLEWYSQEWFDVEHQVLAVTQASPESYQELSRLPFKAQPCKAASALLVSKARPRVKVEPGPSHDGHAMLGTNMKQQRLLYDC